MTRLGAFQGVNSARHSAFARAASAIPARILAAVAAVTWLAVAVLTVRALSMVGGVA